MWKLLLLFGLVLACACIVPGQTTMPIAPGREEEEAAFGRAIKILAKDFEQRSGFHFDKDWEPRVSVEYGLGNGRMGEPAAMYVAEQQAIKFPISLTYRLCVDHDKVPVRLMKPEIMASDKPFASLVAHELGHVLMDQVSRRSGLGPWFTVELFNSKDVDEQLGMNILSEGTAMYFQEMKQAPDDRLSEVAFPASEGEFARRYTYDMVVNDGGLWLVRDILAKHGERGMIWILKHPFRASSIDMRKAAVEYRARALDELAKK